MFRLVRSSLSELTKWRIFQRPLTGPLKERVDSAATSHSAKRNADRLTSTGLQSPLGRLASQLSDSDLRLTAYHVFHAVCHTSFSKPLSTSASFNSDSPSLNSSTSNNDGNNNHNWSKWFFLARKYLKRRSDGK